MFKKYIKVVISILTLCIVLFNNTYTCYAVSSNVTAESWLKQLGDAVKTFTITLEVGEHLTSNALRDYVKKSFDSVGFMIDETGVLINKIKTAIHGVDNDFDDQTATEDDIAQWIVDNTEVVNGDVVFGDKYNDFIIAYHDDYVNDNPKYGYAFNLQTATNMGDYKAALAEVIENNPNKYVLIYTANYSNSVKCFVYDGSSDIYGVIQSGTSAICLIKLYRAVKENNVISVSKYYATSDNFKEYTYDPNTKKFIEDNALIEGEIDYIGYVRYSTDTIFNGSNFNSSPAFFGDYKIPIFSSFNALETYVNNIGVGKDPYYYNNSVWSNFVNNSSGDYTVTTSNVNTVTYGDTVTYINDYHDTNNNYPDNSTVNNWITTTNNNNNTGGGSGGGSGGSGDDSGGSGIVSILTALGKAIADLITGIAAFLAEVVGGLVEAITGLLDTLTDLITNFTESIPNIFSPLLGWLFDGLPEEFTAIILLGLTACVIASIIKILRG